MGFWKGLKKTPSHIFDFRADRWIGFQNLKEGALYFYRQALNLFRISNSTNNETFEQAQERLNLTEDVLENKKKYFLYSAFFYLILSLGLFIYSVLLIIWDNLMGACMSFALMIYAWSAAFRHHFWYFQIKQKKLGCSLSDWAKALYRGRSEL